LFLALVTVAACSGGGVTATSDATIASTTSASSSTTSTTTSTATTTEPPSTSTSTTDPVPADPSFADTPEGECSRLTPDSIGFRNETGTAANDYRQIGESTEGRTIWSEHWGPSTGPQVLVFGQVHGDECAPAFMVRAIREHPPTEFGLWLVPTLNPDGLAGHHRRTALDIDPNRDGYDLVTPEAQAAMHVTELVQPILTVHLHSPYKWVGAHNGLLATQVATAMSQAAGWGFPKNAGRVRKGTQAFLWEGQERVIPGHQSVLVEFPATSPFEAPYPPDPTQRVEGTVAEVIVAAEAMRIALYDVVLRSVASN
jgi:hypothetical protein